MSHTDWLKEVPEKTLEFLESLRLEGGRYRYSASGDILPQRLHWGLGNSVFAIKILYTLGEADERGEINEARERIMSFRSASGYFSDPWVKLLSFPARIARGILGASLKKVSYAPTRRGETRQALSALSLTGEVPPLPQDEVPASPTAVNRFLNSLDWSLPWSAGAHFSHMMFFISKSAHPRKEELLETAMQWLSKVSRDDGAWYKGKPSLQQRINGAMKVITGMRCADRVTLHNPEALIDLCLSAIHDEQACDNFNVVYTLRYASKAAPDYRKTDVRRFALDRLEVYQRHYFPQQGGFSFSPRRANRIYYDAPITFGRTEPDIHGTVMFLWGLSIIGQMVRLPISLQEHTP